MFKILTQNDLQCYVYTDFALTAVKEILADYLQLAALMLHADIRHKWNVLLLSDWLRIVYEQIHQPNCDATVIAPGENGV